MGSLNKKDLERFKKVLVEIRKKIAGDLQHLEGDSLNTNQRDASGDLSGYSFHMADMATDNYDREFDLNMVTNEQEVLYRIDEALKRIEEKTYGLCQSCQKPITKMRLKALPFAELCLSCQSKEEKGK